MIFLVEYKISFVLLIGDLDMLVLSYSGQSGKIALAGMIENHLLTKQITSFQEETNQRVLKAAA